MTRKWNQPPGINDRDRVLWSTQMPSLSKILGFKWTEALSCLRDTFNFCYWVKRSIRFRNWFNICLEVWGTSYTAKLKKKKVLVSLTELKTWAMNIATSVKKSIRFRSICSQTQISDENKTEPNKTYLNSTERWRPRILQIPVNRTHKTEIFWRHITNSWYIIWNMVMIGIITILVKIVHVCNL